MSGFSPEKLARIPAFLQARIAAGDLPGAQIQIWRRGQLAHHSLMGLMDIEQVRPMREDTIYRIYSMTKPITSVAALMLLEQGKLALDDAVAKYISGFAGLKLPDGTVVGQTMTVRDLMRHTAGFTYSLHNNNAIDAQYRALRLTEMDNPGGLPAMIAGLQSLPLEYAPGTQWVYSVASDVLGYLVQTVSRVSLADFLRENILTPLKMFDTDFMVPRAKADRFAACYQQTQGRLEVFSAYPNAKYFDPPLLESGGGGLAGTASDYLRFARMLLNGGALDGVRLLEPETVAQMTQNQLPGGGDITSLSPAGSAFTESGYSGIGFGLGVSVTLDPAKVGIPGTVGEFGWGGMASTLFFVDPLEDMAVVFMTQVITDTPRRVMLRRQLRSLIYDAMTDKHA